MRHFEYSRLMRPALMMSIFSLPACSPNGQGNSNEYLSPTMGGVASDGDQAEAGGRNESASGVRNASGGNRSDAVVGSAGGRSGGASGVMASGGGSHSVSTSPEGNTPVQGGGSSKAGGSTSVLDDSGELGYSEIPDGRGGFNVEQVSYPAAMHFDKQRSLQAFQSTLYPLLRDNCAMCHSTENSRGAGAQAPIHADVDPALAHEYALTRVNFRHPEDSKFVVRMGIDRHNCFGASCKDASAQMLAAVKAWGSAIADLLPVTPRTIEEGVTVPESDVLAWIKADRAELSSDDAAFIKYASLHELHNAGVSAEQLNVARVALSKALNSTARWAPEVVNPVDINGKGMVYRFDMRDYWGYNKGVKELIFGGSDDDLFFGTVKDVNGKTVTQDVLNHRFNYAASITKDPNFAKMVWARVSYGNAEAAKQDNVEPNIQGFKSDYIEASQLVYTLTRPDVYNAIMALPMYALELENELGVIKDKGLNSYQYVVTHEAITVDSRLYFRARTKTGWYWKTFDIFTGQANPDDQMILGRESKFPFWEHPIPKFVAATGLGGTAKDLTFIATIAQPLKANAPASCDGQVNYGGEDFLNCRYYTGTGGLQQSAEESIWDLPNGLQGYALFGGFNQRRIDAFTNIVRDPRILRNLNDKGLTTQTGFVAPDHRLNEGASCMGCHTDGLNRGNNNLRDWLEEDDLPAGKHGADSWKNDDNVKEQVRSLYPRSSELRPIMEGDRRLFMTAMAKIRGGMAIGPDKNTYVEPIVWTFEWAQKHYNYPTTTSN